MSKLAIPSLNSMWERRPPFSGRVSVVSITRNRDGDVLVVTCKKERCEPRDLVAYTLEEFHRFYQKFP